MFIPGGFGHSGHMGYLFCYGQSQHRTGHITKMKLPDARSCLLCVPAEHCAQKAANSLWLMLDDLALGVLSSLLDCN